MSIQRDKPLVTVIIPIYNNEKYIAETINSVLSQTYESFELLVIDDGSADSSAEIVKSFSDERIKYYYQENNGGNSARNQGIKMSKGEYIATLDADDIWFPEKLENQMNEFFKDPEVGLVYGWLYYINPEGELIDKKEIHIQGDHYLRLLLGNYLNTGSLSLIKKECFENVGNFINDINTCQEWDMGLRIARRYKFACVKDYICKYRIHSESVSKDSNFYNLIKKDGLDILNREFAEDYPGLDSIKTIVFSNRYRYLSGLCRNHKNHKEALDNMYNAIKTYPLTLTDKKTIISIIKLLVSVILPDKIINYFKNYFL